MSAQVDTSQLLRLIGDLAAAPAEVARGQRRVLVRGALNIKRALQASVSGHPTLPYFPRSITYDITDTFGGVEAEIGPDKAKRQGPLGNIVFYGTSRNAPIASLSAPAEAEAPVIEKYLADVAVKSILRRF